MVKYLSFLGTCFKSNFTYKADYILSIVFNMVFFFIFLAIWKYIYSDLGNSTIAAYSLSSVITYYFITSLIYRTNLDDAVWLGSDIWRGEFTNNLIKPWNPVIMYIFATFSEMITTVGMYLPFFAVMFLIAHQYIMLPSVIYLIYFLITLILTFFLNLWINYSLHSLTFYWGDQSANKGLLNYLIAFLAGGYFPLAFLPDGLAWFKYLPFRFLFDVPANIFLQKLSFREIGLAWAQMIVWIVIFYTIFNFIYKSGLKRYTGTGR